MHSYFYVEEKEIKNRKPIAVLLIFAGWIYVYVMKGMVTGFDGADYTNLPQGYACCGTFIMATGLYLLMVSRQAASKAPFATKLRNVVTLAADNTLGIYYIHCLYLSVISYRMYPLIDGRGVFVNFIKAVIVLLLSLGTALLMKKIPVLKELV